MDCRSLQTLQGNFNRISSLWLATAEGGFVSRATPQATDYHNALSEHLQAGLRSSLTDLVDYASGRRDWVAMPARREAVTFMIEQGLENPKADATIKLATLDAIDQIRLNMGTAAITDAAIGRIGAFPVAGHEAATVAVRRAEVVQGLARSVAKPAC